MGPPSAQPPRYALRMMCQPRIKSIFVLMPATAEMSCDGGIFVVCVDYFCSNGFLAKVTAVVCGLTNRISRKGNILIVIF